jgi:6-pyruvoyltetrahydropterin/6-carboxytetrahydropterin synthase
MSWRLRVRDKFQAAHFLKEYQGRCEKVHGHTFQVEVMIEVTELDRTGIGIDFTRIKAKLTEILPDHTLLNDVYAFNPTAENLAREFFGRLKGDFSVIEVTVWESEDASATYSEDR